jgi:hypothetical protein
VIHAAISGLTSTDSGTITVGPALASTLSVSGFTSSAIAGTAYSFTVTAKDIYGNTATGYGGTVKFSSSDILSVLPSNSTLTNGTGNFSATLNTPGTQSITATDTVTSSITGNQTGITVYGIPTVTSISPSSGTTLGRTPVTITGSNFISGTTVIFGSNPAQNIVVVNSTTITANTPSGTGNVNVVITNAGGTASLTGGFTYVSGLFIFTNNNGTGDGNWSTAGNWSSGAPPSSSNSVEIQANCTVNAAATCNNMTIDNGITLTVGPFALTVTGTTTVGAGTSGTLTISSATGTKAFNGNVTVNSGATWNNTAGNAALTLPGSLSVSGIFNAGTGIYTFSGASQTIAGTLTIPSVTVTGTYTNNGTLTVPTALAGSGGLTNGATGTLNINFTGAVGITTLTATVSGNTVNYGFAGIQTVKPTNYYNLTLSGSGAKTLTSVSTINGSLSMSGSATATTAAAMTVGGNISLSGTSALTTGNTLSITGTLNIGNGTTFTAAGFALTVSGTTTVGGGTSGKLTVSATAGAKLFTGLVTISAGGTWNNSGNSAIEFQGGITNNGTFTAGSGTYTFDTNSQALTGTFVIPNVTVSGTGVTLTNNNALTVATLLTITSPGILLNNGTITATTALSGTGTFTQGATGILNINFTGPAGIAALTATATGNTVNYTGAAQTVKATTYYNLTLSGSGVKTISTAASGTLATGNLTIDHTSGATALVTNTGIVVNTLNLGGVYKAAGNWGYAQDNNYFANTTGYLSVTRLGP